MYHDKRGNKKMNRVEKIMKEAGVDYTPESCFDLDMFDQTRIYTQLTADDVAWDAMGWTGNNIEELKRHISERPVDRIFGIRHGEERSFMLDQDNEYKALFYAWECL
jgi:hypothetical protein